MRMAESIEKFIRKSFEMYDLNYDVFAEQEVTFAPEDAPEIIIKDGLNMFGVAEAAKVLGVSSDDILNMNEDAISKWYRKYNFFRIYSDFLSQWNWDAHFSDNRPTSEEFFIKTIFSDQDNIYSDYKSRYDYFDIKKRLSKTLEEINLVLPGTIHPNAEITNLRIRTETLISFPQCERMVQSFLEMVEHIKKIFFKAIHSELNNNEINELNFLASWFDACDVIKPSTRITYDNILRYRNIYAEENHNDFFEYVKLNRIHFSPWRCKEFLDNPELVKKLLYNFPKAKGEMREFVFELTKFTCEFVWSDAEPTRFSDEEEKFFEEVDKVVGEKHIPIEECAKERTYICVDKNRSETYGWGEYITALKQASGPVSKGGLEIPDRSHILDIHNSFSRIQSRVAAKHGGGNNV